MKETSNIRKVTLYECIPEGADYRHYGFYNLCLVPEGDEDKVYVVSHLESDRTAFWGEVESLANGAEPVCDLYDRSDVLVKDWHATAEIFGDKIVLLRVPGHYTQYLLDINPWDYDYYASGKGNRIQLSETEQLRYRLTVAKSLARIQERPWGLFLSSAEEEIGTDVGCVVVDGSSSYVLWDDENRSVLGLTTDDGVRGTVSHSCQDGIHTITTKIKGGEFSLQASPGMALRISMK